LISGVATAANQWVSPFVTVDLSANWNFPNDSGFLKDAKLQVNVYNALDQIPPMQFVTGASGGFASESANPLGRTFRITLDKKF
jgi:outer membrane receptor protein involved in Fe transport